MRTLVLVGSCLLAVAAGCGPSVVGRACDTSDPCPDRFVCAPAHDGNTRCMRECNLAQTVCNDGTLCLPIGSSSMGGACYLGGNVAIGASCGNDLDCTRTALCLHQGTTSECRVGCNLDGSHECGGGHACQPTSGMTAGFCASM